RRPISIHFEIELALDSRIGRHGLNRCNGPRLRSSAQPPFDDLQRKLGLAAVRATSLGHIRATATAFAAQYLSASTDEIDGVVGLRQIIRHAYGNAGLAILGHTDNGD